MENYHGQGKRGRPIGSTTRPQFRDFITQDEVLKLVKIAKKKAETQPELLKFVLEQVFGKSVQPIGGDKKNPIIVKITGMKIISHGD